MAILAFQKPDKVLMLEADNSFGKFEFRPLEPGYGVTIGNALRRILLSGLEGFAICSIRIDGVQHEFATIPGVKEDVTNIILNLKKVRLKRIVEDTDTEKAVVKVSGQSVFKAGDIGKVLSGFEVLNPELEICHIDPSSGFQIELSINKGRGYVPAEENRNANDPIDVIAIDSIYTPILNVKTTVENFRVEQKTDYSSTSSSLPTAKSFSTTPRTTPTRSLTRKYSRCVSCSRPNLLIWTSQYAPSTASSRPKSRRSVNSWSSTRLTCSSSATSVRSRSVSLRSSWPHSICTLAWISLNTN